MKRYDWFVEAGTWPDISEDDVDMVNMIDGLFVGFNLEQSGMTHEEVYARLSNISVFYVARVWIVELDEGVDKPRSDPALSKSAWSWLVDYCKELREGRVMEFENRLGDRTPEQMLRDWGVPKR